MHRRLPHRILRRRSVRGEEDAKVLGDQKRLKVVIRDRVGGSVLVQEEEIRCSTLVLSGSAKFLLITSCLLLNLRNEKGKIRMRM